MTPDPGSSTPAPPVTPLVSGPVPHQPRPRAGWFQRIGSILFIVFCLELGLFLLIYPWMDAWSGNYFSSLGQIGPLRAPPMWRELWNSNYARGAVSGLGLVNIWVAVAEALRMYIGNDREE